MCGTDRRANSNATDTLKWKAASSCSTVVSRNGRHSSPPPALFTRMSRPPSAATVRSTRSGNTPMSFTSAVQAKARPPAASISAATRSISAVVRAVTATAAPASAKPRAIASPMPRPPPVIERDATFQRERGHRTDTGQGFPAAGEEAVGQAGTVLVDAAKSGTARGSRRGRRGPSRRASAAPRQWCAP